MAAKKRRPGAGRPYAEKPRICRLGGVRLTEEEMDLLERAQVSESPDGYFAPWVRDILLKHAQGIINT